MNHPPLPDAIQLFVDATNRADSNAFVQAFSHNAHLDDWGRGFDGHTGIRSWDTTDNIGKNSHFELRAVETGNAPDTYIVTLDVSGDGFNGTSPFTFRLEDGLIAEVTIS